MRRRRPVAPGWEGLQIFAIGHSTRSIEEMIDLLWSHGVAILADIRTVPRSRTNPQFNLDTFPATLKSAGIGHVHLAALGGLRKTRPDSPNAGWRNASFRGFADYMQTPEFEQGLEELRGLARQGPAPRAVYVTDELSGREVEAAAAYFVSSLVVTRPATQNRIHAFGDRAAAERHAESGRGQLLEGDERPFR